MAGGLGGPTVQGAYGASEIGRIGGAPTGPSGALGGPMPWEKPKPVATGGGGGGRGSFRAPKMQAITAKAPPRPTLPPIDPQAEFDPELEAYRERYKGHLTNLEEGTGYAMDVLRQGQQDSGEASIERMRASAAEAGIPFDESQARAELQRGVNASMAQEKLGREAAMTGAYDVGKGITALPAEERFARLDLDLNRDVAESEGVLDLYGRDIQRYGTDVAAATAANQSLMGFYNNLMSGMFGMMGNSMGGPSYSSSNYYG